MAHMGSVLNWQPERTDSRGAEVGWRLAEGKRSRIAGPVVENTVVLLVQGRICSKVAALMVEHYMVIVLEEH